MNTIRDKLWLFGMPVIDRHRRRDWLPPGHLMTATEAACYLGIPNALWVVQHNFPEPPFDSYARPLSALKRVVWSVLGDSSSDRSDVDEVLRLAERFPNITGGILDDFFQKPNGEGRVARFGLQELEQLRDRLHAAVRRLDLWAVIYAHQLDLPVEEYLERCDVITFWTWWADHLTELEGNFTRLEAMAGRKRKLLGCYLIDPGGEKLIPLELMKRQCELGLKWLREGRVEGLILLGNPMCGLGLEAVEWTREWISEVGERPL